MDGFNVAQLLDDREERYKKQIEMITVHNLPIISFTINTPGSEKNNKIIKHIFESGLKEIESVLLNNSIEIMDRYYSTDGLSGPIIILSLSSNPIKLKELMIGIENKHSLGRLLDIDVIDEQLKHISRTDLGFETRKCLICNEYAKICSRSQRHDMTDVLNKFYDICFSYLANQNKKT
ncbi:MAG: citrate lyase holo-[acyl-carrier protein] synthase [Dethiosulfatibacter sp.]|nr:citrate lyase holo-[acyl-carrier protein] synthase [Dethiosulfatibacter sp.]